MENERRVQQKAPASRYALLDELRGLDLISMMLFHVCWDLVFLFDMNMGWYVGTPGRLWQQSICWVFILLSGFCVPLGRHTLRRGTVVFGAGAVVTLATLVFMPEGRVIFGVLTFLGTAMLLTGVLEPVLKRTPAACGTCSVGGVVRAVQSDLLGLGGPWRLEADAAAEPVCQLLYCIFWLLPGLVLLRRLLWPAAVAVFVLGGVLPAQGGGPQTHGTTAPLGVPGAGLDGPALAFAVSAASAGDLRRTFGRGSSFCIKGLTQPGSCGILSMVRRY